MSVDEDRFELRPGRARADVCSGNARDAMVAHHSARCSMSAAAPVSALLHRFHASRPVRAWSLIVTLYGDAIVPRGGSLWLGSLTEIMDLFGIDAGHVRTACSR